MKNLPLGIQTFDDLIRRDFLYIDKTPEIYKLIASGGKYFFLSRPRRFGKSLLLSTLKEIFSGNKELFKNLWIYDKITWESHPVIHIDLTALAYENAEQLKASLEEKLQEIASGYNIKLSSLNYKTKFSELIAQLSRKGKVVVLIDEYDKPIIDKIEDDKISKENREVLKEFYTILKSSDAHIQFVFLTGVSKFTKVSVFSGINNLNDITFDYKYTTLLGYTQQELETYFQEYIEKAVNALDIDKTDLLKEIKDWYNGYSWNGKNFVYNPYSILSFFEKMEFNNYWFSTGTPTFLVKLVKEKKSKITGFEEKAVDSTIFDSYDIDNMDIAPLLFQTGYLTIKKTKKVRLRNQYFLSYPNEEVKGNFLKGIGNHRSRL